MKKQSRAPRLGFTLIELVIVLSILAILAGAAVPMASKFFNSKARQATRTELADLAQAAVEYFRDTSALPGAVRDLLADPGVDGWSGPYLTTSSEDPWSGETDVTVDAWARSYRSSALSASVLELRSAGEDGSFGDATDLTVEIDVTPVRREETLDRLETINQAITQYNDQYLPRQPLPLSYDALLAKLVSSGCLPAVQRFALDGWGDTFVPDPSGKSPVVEVTSIHLDASAGSASGSSATGKQGKGQKKDKGGKQDQGQGKTDSGSGGSDKKDEPKKTGKKG